MHFPSSQVASIHSSSPPIPTSSIDPRRDSRSRDDPRVAQLIDFTDQHTSTVDVAVLASTSSSQLTPHADMAEHFASVAIDMDALEKEIAAKEQARRDASPGAYAQLTGEIAGGSAQTKRRSTRMVDAELETDFDTLDEPVWNTVKRDLLKVGAKFATVLFPKQNDQLLRDWDLWGPLFICVFISLLLQGDTTSKGPHFTEIFTLTFFGSCVVTLNIKLLGGTISFFQSLCVLGYCLLPPGAAALVCHVLEMASRTSTFLFALRLIVTAMGFAWATYGLCAILILQELVSVAENASMAFLSSPSSQPPNRKALVVYPVFLFYFVISWLIFTHAS